MLTALQKLNQKQLETEPPIGTAVCRKTGDQACPRRHKFQPVLQHSGSAFTLVASATDLVLQSLRQNLINGLGRLIWNWQLYPLSLMTKLSTVRRRNCNSPSNIENPEFLLTLTPFQSEPRAACPRWHNGLVRSPSLSPTTPSRLFSCIRRFRGKLRRIGPRLRFSFFFFF